jgi:uncharacterized membrane protein YebE (DUF533 family)
MKTKILSALCIFLALGITSANAQIVKTEKNQHERIKHGVRSGELTKHEAVKLHQDEKAIHQDVKTAKADGVITKDERKEIRHDQKRESHKIYRMKHNNRIRK